MFIFNKLAKLLNHCLIILMGLVIDRKHTGSIADTKDFLSCQLPVDVTRQRCQITDLIDMFLTI